ncbi:hypothetical protein Pyn_22824 [Prunus yedoensis var. nudiflora]|uniref:Uncharacterized protein n=1 Tax=Prunus yedoensis var. nudiflora TaxID=2094558 RepID=A0A314UBF9_PRUYE|nr:hypothetical protein Pyn_22824 [Prunus yedoensis var. nudiflora]
MPIPPTASVWGLCLGPVNFMGMLCLLKKLVVICLSWIPETTEPMYSYQISMPKQGNGMKFLG